MGLRSIGPVAIPELIEALQDDDVLWIRKAAAAEILGSFGPAAAEAVPALIAALRDPQGPTAVNAARALAEIGPVDKKAEAVAGLLAVLNNREGYTSAVRSSHVRGSATNWTSAERRTTRSYKGNT